jgi:hypothetical protein
MAIEQRLTRCQRCDRSIVLSYRRGLIGKRLSSVVITSDAISCPWAGCGHFQAVVVPLEGRPVSAAVWLGQGALPPVSREGAAVRALWQSVDRRPSTPRQTVGGRRSFLRRIRHRIVRFLFGATRCLCPPESCSHLRGW